jgi:hypothetical protein
LGVDHAAARILCLSALGFAKDLAIEMQMDQGSQDEIVLEFQRRRHETWRIVRPWVIVAIPAFMAIAALFATDGLFDELWKLVVFCGCFALLVIAIARSTLVVSKILRCPACGASPKNSRDVVVTSAAVRLPSEQIRIILPPARSALRQYSNRLQ